MEMGGFPAGAVLVKDGKVISEGLALGAQRNDPTGHPETSSIREACAILKTTNLEGATLYESLECCNMCFSIAYWAGIKRIVYAHRKTKEMVKKFYYEGITSNETLNKNNSRAIELIYFPGFEVEVKEIVKEWENR